MKRASRSLLCSALRAFVVLSLAVLSPRSAHAADFTITLGTLAPKSSPWGRVLETWVKAVKEKSGGRMELQIFYNGSQGDEAAMVAKMKAGSLDGGAISAVGLGKIHKPILALQIPGLFTSWPKLDAARDAFKGEFEKGISDAGFRSLGWCDLGTARAMSKGFGVPSPDSLKGKKPYLWRDDPVQTVLYQVIGGITPVPLNTPEVLPNLNTGAINALFAPSLTAEQLQWTGKLDTLGAEIAWLSVGGLVITSKKFEALPEELRTILTDTGKVAASALIKTTRSEDDAAFKRLSGKLKVVTLSDGDRAKWADLYKQLRVKLGQGTFDPGLIAKLEGMAK